MFVGIITHTIYDISGNELPLGAVGTVKTAQLIDVDTIKEAYGIMAHQVIPLRQAASDRYLEAAAEQYLNKKIINSSVDRYDWEVIKMA